MSETSARDPLTERGRRKEDYLTLSRLAKFGLKYNWLITLLFAFFLMLGFGFKTPKDAFSEIHTKVDKNWVIDSITHNELRAVDKQLGADQAYIKDLLESSVLAQCDAMDKSSTRYLPCSRLKRERGLE